MQDATSIAAVLSSYESAVATLANSMRQAVGLLAMLQDEQHALVRRLRKVFARHHSLRHSDFDSILAAALDQRACERDRLGGLVEQYDQERRRVVAELRELLCFDVARAVRDWPAVKTQLLSGQDGSAGVISALRQAHMAQQELSAALSGLLGHAEQITVHDLKTAARSLAGLNRPDRPGARALLAACESAALDAGMTWRRLAG